MCANDSDGTIRDAVRALVGAPAGGSAGEASTAKLVDQLIRFQFNNDCDYFQLDPRVAHAPMR